MSVDRRQWLKFAGGLAAMAATHRTGVALAAAPANVGRKFADDGRVLPFAGNTILCHLPQQGADAEPLRALIDLYRALPSEPFARRFTALPSHSLHMTVFGGANDLERNGPGWPSGLPRDMPIEECTRILGERLAGFATRLHLPIRMVVDPGEGQAGDDRLTLYLLPADASENARLRELRDRLSALLGIRQPNHDSYRFHITLAYRVQPLGAPETHAFRAFRTHWHGQVASRCPELRLGPLEYCAFTDMFHFDQRLILR
jgi:hypothetical protein